MQILSSFDQTNWPYNLLQFELTKKDDFDKLLDSFKKWPKVFPSFAGNGALTEEKMEEILGKIIDFLRDGRRSGSLWCRTHKSSPANFWSLLLVYMGNELDPNFRRLLMATLSVPFGSAGLHLHKCSS